ncbi:MAG TPA: plastocyanin/azurin family copper-binding protein [Vicinamibacterales bacterium]
MKFRLSVLAGLIGLAVGCGSSSPSSPSNGNTGTPVSIVANSSTLTTTAYSPNPVSISVGGTVTWTNNDSTAHTATGDNGSFSSGNIAPGGKFSQTFSTAGTFTYKCTLHPNMVGTVTVR